MVRRLSLVIFMLKPVGMGQSGEPNKASLVVSARESLILGQYILGLAVVCTSAQMIHQSCMGGTLVGSCLERVRVFWLQCSPI